MVLQTNKIGYSTDKCYLPRHSDPEKAEKTDVEVVKRRKKMEKLSLNSHRTKQDVCGSEWAYWLKTAGKPSFNSLKQLTEAILAKVIVPEWAKGRPVIIYTSGGPYFGKPTVVWYTGGSYKGGEYSNTTYF